MGVRLRETIGRQLRELRYEPTAKRIRAVLNGTTVVDSDRAVLVWEPRRVVPTYAVPADDIAAELVPQPPSGEKQEAAGDVGFALPDVTTMPVLDPRVPFSVHSTDGETVAIRTAGDGARSALGFRPADEDLSGYVVLDFDGFDRWLEEDDEIVGHPHDPFQRIDVRRTSRHVRVMLGDTVLAETRRARMLFETMLPVRYYLPPEDVVAELRPSATTTFCAYKGEAAYWSAVTPDGVLHDIAWRYDNPLVDATEVRGLLAFFDERIDLVIDGVARSRPVTPWS
ncbi:DUF427 domain-containing protein [Rhodococcus jostii]|uniref:Uncharacterized conserved protein, DUF427 family n=1 Tax=Rhodococcus jostii TaxID=132919 RepID=A0A1H5IEJ8_RHOJO|nr:DUF427 domain-containing protein [Rhodococcus jostii]SEE38629.1 Uncharacterized conserved protein, DUF427 family [Rhodococcus jostii]